MKERILEFIQEGEEEITRVALTPNWGVRKTQTLAWRILQELKDKVLST